MSSSIAITGRQRRWGATRPRRRCRAWWCSRRLFWCRGRRDTLPYPRALQRHHRKVPDNRVSGPKQSFGPDTLLSGDLAMTALETIARLMVAPLRLDATKETVRAQLAAAAPGM